jgi:poly(A) polymerase
MSGKVCVLNIDILAKLKAHLSAGENQAYLVGGFLRDSICNRESRDVDIAITGDPFLVARELANVMGGTCVPLSVAHGTARVVIPEVGGQWVIDLSAMDDSINDDLGRRDFTIDALAVPLDDWESGIPIASVIDPFGGLKDLHCGVIRALGPNVFKSDPVRLVRAYRLAFSLGCTVEPSTRQLIARHSYLVGNVAGERLRDEMLAILAQNQAKEHLSLLDGVGLLCIIIPELEWTKGVEQPNEHYWDVFDHSLETVHRAERVTAGVGIPGPTLVPIGEWLEPYFSREVGDGHCRRTLLKVAALLHDIAKPCTKTIDENGRIRFFGHDAVGAEMAAAILKRLRCSSKSVDLVATMVLHHLRPGHMAYGGQLPTGRAIYRYFRDVGDGAVDVLYLNLADHLAARGPELDLSNWRHHTSVVKHMLKNHTGHGTNCKPSPLANGHDIMAEFDLGAGPLIGRLLEGVHEARAEGRINTKEEALASVSERLDQLRSQGDHFPSISHRSPDVNVRVRR